MQKRVRSDAGRTTIICVDSYENGVPSGRFYNYGNLEECHVFQSLIQLITGMQHILDSANYPQAYTVMRSFALSGEQTVDAIEDTQIRKGALATFVVKVLFRQHTSWQGSVIWEEARCDESFRSVLELILLLESALSSSSE